MYVHIICIANCYQCDIIYIMHAFKDVHEHLITPQNLELLDINTEIFVGLNF